MPSTLKTENLKRGPEKVDRNNKNSSMYNDFYEFDQCLWTFCIPQTINWTWTKNWSEIDENRSTQCTSL